jgi:peroxiredoxin
MALVHTLALGGAVLAGTLSPLVAGAATGTVKNGSAAPDFVLKSIDGHNLRLSEYQGDVVVLAFWASWCGSCRSALTELNTIASAPESDRPVVLGVNLDRSGGQGSSIAQSLNLHFPTLLDDHQVVGRLYDVETLPLTLLVDRDGIVRASWAAAPAPQAELNRALEEIGK